MILIELILKITKFFCSVILDISLILIFALGIATAYDCLIGDGKMPELTPLQICDRSMININTTEDIHANSFPNEYWDAILPARNILKKISPEISAWLDKLNDEKRIDFYGKGQSLTTIAAWNPHYGLKLTPLFYGLTEGDKVMTICHEYRHSRQNKGKGLRSAVSSMGPNPQESIMENDAYIFEQHAGYAIYGWNASYSPIETVHSLNQNTYGRR